MAQNGIKLEELKIESSSCRRTMTSIGRKVMKTSKCVFRTLRQLRLAYKDSQRDVGLSSDQEPKKSGMGRTRVSPNVSGTARRIDDAYHRRKRISCISSDKCVGSRILEKQKM